MWNVPVSLDKYKVSNRVNPQGKEMTSGTNITRHNCHFLDRVIVFHDSSSLQCFPSKLFLWFNPLKDTVHALLRRILIFPAIESQSLLTRVPIIVNRYVSTISLKRLCDQASQKNVHGRRATWYTSTDNKNAFHLSTMRWPFTNRHFGR